MPHTEAELNTIWQKLDDGTQPTAVAMKVTDTDTEQTMLVGTGTYNRIRDRDGKWALWRCTDEVDSARVR